MKQTIENVLTNLASSKPTVLVQKLPPVSIELYMTPLNVVVVQFKALKFGLHTAIKSFENKVNVSKLKPKTFTRLITTYVDVIDQSNVCQFQSNTM